jgi:carbonic anhydrase
MLCPTVSRGGFTMPASSPIFGCLCGAGVSGDRCQAHPGALDGLSRRRFLATGVVAGALAGIALGSGPAAAQAAMSPDEALQRLKAGNQRFSTGNLTSIEEDLKVLKAKNAESQAPFAGVLACADSRVPVELVFDETIGRIFVTRVAGNIASAEIIASLEYGAAVLGTKVIVVMAHSNCGAVKATIDAKPVPGQISVLYRYIRPAVDQAGSGLEAASKANAKIQAGLLRKASPVLAGLIKKNQLKVAAAYYDVGTGNVTWL